MTPQFTRHIFRDWAHGWAFGFHHINITKQGLLFHYKIPMFINANDPYNGSVVFEFYHQWTKARYTHRKMRNQRKLLIYNTILAIFRGWELGIFSPTHPKMTDDEYIEMENDCAYLVKNGVI